MFGRKSSTSKTPVHTNNALFKYKYDDDKEENITIGSTTNSDVLPPDCKVYITCDHAKLIIQELNTIMDVKSHNFNPSILNIRIYINYLNNLTQFFSDSEYKEESFNKNNENNEDIYKKVQQYLENTKKEIYDIDIDLEHKITTYNNLIEKLKKANEEYKDRYKNEIKDTILSLHKYIKKIPYLILWYNNKINKESKINIAHKNIEVKIKIMRIQYDGYISSINYLTKKFTVSYEILKKKIPITRTLLFKYLCIYIYKDIHNSKSKSKKKVQDQTCITENFSAVESMKQPLTTTLPEIPLQSLIQPETPTQPEAPTQPETSSQPNITNNFDDIETAHLSSPPPQPSTQPEKTYTITCENATRIMKIIRAGFIPNSIISLHSLQIPISVGLGKEKTILTIIQSIDTSNNTFKIQTQMLQEDIDINKLTISTKVNGEQCEEKKIIVSNPKPTTGGNKTHKKPMKGGNYNNSSISTSSLC